MTDEDDMRLIPIQAKLLETIERNVAEGSRSIHIEAPTGIGANNAVAAYLARAGRQALVATSPSMVRVWRMILNSNGVTSDKAERMPDVVAESYQRLSRQRYINASDLLKGIEIVVLDERYPALDEFAARLVHRMSDLVRIEIAKGPIRHAFEADAVINVASLVESAPAPKF